ncbi:hypothetical protein [Helicobacter pylori]|uniref:hypothetical protein n=1 Tax=Helicobacter pylori TaxID=210 RepID=UPI003F933B51
MWNEKILKIIPTILFLFCLLEILELALIIDGMNKVEKLEAETRNNLKALEDIAILLNKHLEYMQLDTFKDKKINIK